MGIKLRNPVSARGLEEEMLKVRAEAFKLACINANGEIKIRSQNLGRDYTGKPFKKYSEGYAQERERLGLQVSPPNLTRTGQMFKAQQVRFQELGNAQTVAEFYFADGSAGTKAQFVNRLREFFRLSPGQLTAIKNAIRKALR
jgi:hypothetical protein